MPGSRDLRPAFYILRSRHPVAKWFNLLHWPYLALHLSFPTIGAALAPELNLALLGWTVLAFFLAMGVGSHACDLLQGDPLGLDISPLQLAIAAVLAMSGAATIGLVLIATGVVPLWLLVAIPVGVLLGVGYGMEWRGLHGDWQFATFWAVFPLLVAFLAQGIHWTWSLMPMCAFAFLIAWGQRVLSARVRQIRRRTGRVKGTMVVERPTWQEVSISKEWLIRADETALTVLSFAMPMLALGILLWR